MDLTIINPIDYPGWDHLLLSNAESTFFYSSAWARILEKSYHYKPVYFSFFEDSRLVLLMPFMDISSPLTGKRGVSLPFTDQCDPLVFGKMPMENAVKRVLDYAGGTKWNFLEWRTTGTFVDGITPSEIFYTHEINLNKEESSLFSSLRESNRRSIRKSIREGVYITIEQSLSSLKSFCWLNYLTRKRHGLPPQPYNFYKNVYDHALSKDLGIIATASYANRIIAASVFFHFGFHAIFKYGASDPNYQNLRPSNLIMWEVMKWYRDRGFRWMSLGRTELDNPGLLQFKRSWGSIEKSLYYYQYNLKKRAYIRSTRINNFSKYIFGRIPISMLRIIGRLFYKHFG